MRRRQRAGRAGLHAFAAGDAGRLAHRIVEVEHDLRMPAAIRVADDVVDLLLAAGAHAARALDARVEVDRHRRMREVGGRLRARARSAACRRRALRCQNVELGVGLVDALRACRRRAARRSSSANARARALSLVTSMPARRLAAARRRQHALALDLDHARAAVAVGPHARACSRAAGSATPRRSATSMIVSPGAAATSVAVQLEARSRRTRVRASVRRRVAFIGSSISCGKYLTTHAIGFGAACPSPQIDASAIACDSSSSSGWSQRGSRHQRHRLLRCRRGTACTGRTTRRRRTPSGCSAASRARSCCDSMITAAEPMKQPCGCSVSKSSGMSPSDAGRMPPDAPPGR